MKVPVIAVALLLIGSVAHAQSERAARPADGERVAVNTVGRLFEGILLTPEQHQRAVAIVKDAQTEQQKLLGQNTRQAWDRIVALQVTRDSSLRVLLTSDADRLTFEKRAAEMMPKPPPTP